MDWFQTIAAEVVAGRLRLILKGELRQREVQDPIIFQGVAHIDQDAQGGLALRFVCESASDSFDPEVGLPKPRKGKITAEHFHFDLSGTDSEAQLWTAERILLCLDRPSEKLGFPTKPDGFDVALGQIPEIVTEHPCEMKDGNRSEMTWVVPGKLPSPCPGVGLPWKIQVDECSGSVVYDNEQNTVIGFDAPSDQIEVMSSRFHRALSMLSSRHLQPRCLCKRSGGVEAVHILSRKRHVESQALLWIPTRHWDGWNLFIEKWLSANQTCHSAKAKSDGRPIQDVIYHFWYRFYRAYSVDIENGAQVLTSSIEGMAKRYFAVPPAQLVTEREQEFASAKEFLKRADRKKFGRAVDMLTAAIKNEADNKRPAVEFLLDALVNDRRITGVMVKSWNNIRHKAAHGDHLITTSADIERFDPDFFQCFEAFKRLCMFAIDYDGPAQDFSVEGWPVLRNAPR
ncbi:TPA: hypothetical protein ACKPYB_000654 [Stenotrophomonas maltophilia]